MYLLLLIFKLQQQKQFFCFSQLLRKVLEIINFYLSKVPNKSILIGTRNHPQVENRRILSESKIKYDLRCNVPIADNMNT